MLKCMCYSYASLYSFIGKRRTALHLAASNGRSTALKLILRMIATVQDPQIVEYLIELLDEDNVSFWSNINTNKD